MSLKDQNTNLKDQFTNLKDQITNLKDQVTSLKEKLEIDYAEHAASGRLNFGQYFNIHIPDNINGKQPEELNLMFFTRILNLNFCIFLVHVFER